MFHVKLDLPDLGKTATTLVEAPVDVVETVIETLTDTSGKQTSHTHPTSDHDISSGAVPVSPDNHDRISTYFLGNKAENQALLQRLFTETLQEHSNTRRAYYPDDPAFISSQIQASAAFEQGVSKLEENFGNLSRLLNEYSVPFYSGRYAGHMSFESSMPSTLGWLLTILNNPNNVAFEASPITTLLELEVGADLCQMLGFRVEADNPSTGWGHIACDGTVANLESIWAARNLKFYPLSLREAMKKGRPLAFIADTFKVQPCASQGEEVLFEQLSTWELLNLKVKDILDIPGRLQEDYGISSTFLETALSPHLVQTTGKDVLEKLYKLNHPSQYLISSTKHYSWPKGAAIAGLGSDNMVDIPVDTNAHVRIDLLRQALQERLDKQQAVYAVVGIIGSTEEGAVDPLDEIVRLRDEFQAKGLSFVVHADAAWGGYFASMIREPADSGEERAPQNTRFVPSLTLRDSTVSQFQALQYCDSITIDPHKSGYVPYPAGGLCYKDGRMRFLLTWTAPYLSQGSGGESIGIYGVEGSKPGAPASAAWLHHQVVGLDKYGHGMLLGEVSFTCSRFASHWAAMSDNTTNFIVVPFNPLVSEPDEEKVQEEKKFIRDRILNKSNEDLLGDAEAMKELRDLGSDLNINAFTCNFRINGEVNMDVEEANYLNNRVFQALSVTDVHERPENTPFFLSATTLELSHYGDCATNFKKRLGLETESQQDLFVLRNVVMSPFQSTGNFIKELADIFQQTLEREIQVVVARNTIKPQTHTFILQGTHSLFLVYNPTFHNANGRRQLIVSATIDHAGLQSLLALKGNNPSEVYTISTSQPDTVDNLLGKGSFDAIIHGKGAAGIPDVQVKLGQVLKDRTLESRYRDPDYPTLTTPFYLYGTQHEQHIDHMLLRAPNVQLNSERVQLQLNKELTAEQLSNGLIMYLDRHEASMQPIDGTNPPSFFKAGATFNVSIYKDARAPTAHGPGLATINSHNKVTTGKVTLGQAIHVDYTALNNQEFGNVTHALRGVTSTKTNASTRAGWKMVMQDRLGINMHY